MLSSLSFLSSSSPLLLSQCKTCLASHLSLLQYHKRYIHKELVNWAGKLSFNDFQGLVQKRFSIEQNLEELYPQLRNHEPYKVAAVTMAFYELNNDIHILMIKRASRGKHGGQIGFPGGKKDPEDTSFLDAALRETHEEVGITPSTHNMQIIGNLPPLLSYQHRFYVVPYVASLFSPSVPTYPIYTPPSTLSHTPSSLPPSPLPTQTHNFVNFPPYTIQPAEVEYVLDPTLRELAAGYHYNQPDKATPELSLDNLQLGERANIEWVSWRGPIFILPRPGRDVLWGLSARIIVDFLKMLKPTN